MSETRSAATGFPTLRIRPDSFEARGAFAETQAIWLRPDRAAVARIDRLLAAGDIGVVAHFYMDAELQGVLSAASWPHIHISDSLVMADRAVAMVEAGARAIVVLGVDFMSENVRAMLDAAGHDRVPVFRVAAEPIGCSLAASAEDVGYGAWLTQAAATPRSLHVVYINTSLATKAKSHALVPTITCTSSNVVHTVLQAAAQIADLHVWFGPDTYMGHNLQALFAGAVALGPDAVAALHPAHDEATLAGLAARFHPFEQGACVVHHLFGADVVARVRRDHADAYLTAHLEVPGEMFALAAEAQRRGRGVVGSTSDLLKFIQARVDEAVARPEAATLAFVLGTEAGMVTAIVRRVQAALVASGRTDIAVDIIFPVASEAISATGEADLGVVPGVPSGEGCSTAGGCATCPYMKMNSLDALIGLVETLAAGNVAALDAFRPRKYADNVTLPGGGERTVADLGSEPILFMRDLQRSGRLPEALVRMVVG